MWQQYEKEMKSTMWYMITMIVMVSVDKNQIALVHLQKQIKEKSDNTFIPPTAQTVEEFLELFVELYRTKKWSLSTYEKSNRTITNHINPYIGKIKVQKITPLIIERYYADLKKEPSIANKSRKTNKTVTTDTVKHVHKILRCAFWSSSKMGCHNVQSI